QETMRVGRFEKCRWMILDVSQIFDFGMRTDRHCYAIARCDFRIGSVKEQLPASAGAEYGCFRTDMPYKVVFVKVKCADTVIPVFRTINIQVDDEVFLPQLDIFKLWDFIQKSLLNR